MTIDILKELVELQKEINYDRSMTTVLANNDLLQSFKQRQDDMERHLNKLIDIIYKSNLNL